MGIAILKMCIGSKPGGRNAKTFPFSITVNIEYMTYLQKTSGQLKRVIISKINLWNE